MRIVCASYRDWALKIYDHLAQNTDHTILIIRSKEQFSEEAILTFQPNMILFRMELDREQPPAGNPLHHAASFASAQISWR